MDLQKVMDILAVVGVIAVGLPVMLRALLAFLKLIPGEQPDKVVEKVLGVSEKIADVVGKLYPKAPEIKMPEQK